jgi:hypothetical protein
MMIPPNNDQLTFRRLLALIVVYCGFAAVAFLG